MDKTAFSARWQFLPPSPVAQNQGWYPPENPQEQERAMIHWNGPLNPLPNLCRQQLWHCISSQALHHPPCPLGPLDTVFSPLLPSCILSVPMGSPASSCCTRTPAQPCQDCGSWGSRTGKRGGERSTTAVSHDPGHSSTLQSPFLHPAARRQCRPPALAWGTAHLWQRGEKRWVSLGSSLQQSQAG